MPGTLPSWRSLLAAWMDLEPAPQTIALVGEVRRRGIACYLATNQDAHRGPIGSGIDELRHRLASHGVLG
jgi:hypothetical protein